MKKWKAYLIAGALAVVTFSTTAVAQLPTGTFQRSSATIRIIDVIKGGPGQSLTLVVSFRPAGCQSGAWNLFYSYFLPRSYNGTPIVSGNSKFSGAVQCNGSTINLSGGSDLTSKFVALNQNQIEFTAISGRMDLSAYSGIYDRSSKLVRKRGVLPVAQDMPFFLDLSPIR